MQIPGISNLPYSPGQKIPVKQLPPARQGVKLPVRQLTSEAVAVPQRAGIRLPAPKVSPAVAAKTIAKKNGVLPSRVTPAKRVSAAASKAVPAKKRALAVAAASPAGGGGGTGGTAPPNPYQAKAQAEVDPIIAAITAAATGQAQAADQAIQGLTNSYAQGISGIDYGAPYSSGEAQQAAVDAALQQSATGQGSDLAAALSQRLQALQGSSGAPAVEQEAQSLASQGSGIGGAQLATGSAALNQLISDAAAAKSYGQKMPGVIDSAGLQGIEQSQGQAQQAINQGTLQAESQLPQIEQNLKADALQTQATKADTAYKNAELALRGQSNQISAFRAKTSAQQGAARIQVERLRAAIAQNQGQQRINIEAQRAAQSALNENRNFQLGMARLGISQKNLQLRWAAQQAKLANGGYTPEEARKIQLQANQIAGDAAKHHGVNGQGLPGLQEVMHTMALNDIPPTIALKAVKLAGYQPGKVGMFTGLAKYLSSAGQSPLAAAGSAAQTAAGGTIVGLAKEYLGTPYVWGGESPKGFDCSGFAQFMYAKAGINIPRTTYTQWDAGKPVAKNSLLPGDLVFFKGGDSIDGKPGHVGIYIGNGKMINEPHTGSSAQIANLAGFPGYMGARRFGKG